MIIKDLSQAQYGDIILFEPTMLLSRIQVWIDNLGRQKKYNYSHGAIFWGHVGHTPLMIESVSPCGVHIAKVQNWRNYIIVRPENNILMTQDELSSYLNKRYDYSKLWSVITNKFFGVPMTIDNDEQVICTELINLAYYYALCQKGKCTPVTLATSIL